jgi:hypothetical protein
MVFAGSGFALEQKRHLQSHGNIDNLGKFIIQNIARCPGKSCGAVSRHHHSFTP